MKYSIFIAMGMITLFPAFAQSPKNGINTKNPVQLFHIDGKGDNAVSGPITIQQQSNDVVITENGEIGVGTNTPNAKLDIVTATEYSGFKLEDGNQGQGKFLASNTLGQATWVNSPLTPVVFGELDNSTLNFDVNPDSYIRDKITLGKGRWLVYIGKLLSSRSIPNANNNAWVRLTLSSQQLTNSNTNFNFLSSNLVSGWLESINTSLGERFTFLSGIIAVEVTTNSATLYLRTREFTTIGSAPVAQTRGNFGENYLYALPTY